MLHYDLKTTSKYFLTLVSALEKTFARFTYSIKKKSTFSFV